MRFLCLHGMGTNSRIFEIQTGQGQFHTDWPALLTVDPARIRLSLGDDHDFVFLDGPIRAPPAPGVNELMPDGGEYLRWAEDRDLDTALELYNHLEDFVRSDGPFQGVIGFSEGAGVGASLLAYQEARSAAGLESPFAFSCGVFFCGAPPVDIAAMRKGILQPVRGRGSIKTPIAHIWDPNDTVHPGFGDGLRALCDDTASEQYIHGLGHVVPGIRSNEGVREIVRAIRRTIERGRSL